MSSEVFPQPHPSSGMASCLSLNYFKNRLVHSKQVHVVHAQGDNGDDVPPDGGGDLVALIRGDAHLSDVVFVKTNGEYSKGSDEDHKVIVSASKREKLPSLGLLLVSWSHVDIDLAYTQAIENAECNSTCQMSHFWYDPRHRTNALNEASEGEGAAAVDARHLSPSLDNEPFFECVARLGLVHPPRTRGFHSLKNCDSRHMSIDVVDLQALDVLFVRGLALCRLW